MSTLETSYDPADAWKQAKQTGAALKRVVTEAITRIAAGGVKIEDVFELHQRIENAKNQLDPLILVAGLDTYVATIKPSYVATINIQAVSDAAQGVMDWINTNASGLNLTGDSASNWLASGSIVTDRFSSAQLSGLTTALQAINAAIS